MKWERLPETPHYGNAYRTRVPGGWLVLADTWARHRDADDKRHYDSTGVGITFYPDPDHRWTLSDGDTQEDEA